MVIDESMLLQRNALSVFRKKIESNRLLICSMRCKKNSQLWTQRIGS